MGGTCPSKAEITQESPRRCDQLLTALYSAFAGPLENELSHPPCVPLVDILTKCFEKFEGAATIKPQSWLCCATVLLEPITKANNQFRRRFLNHWDGVALANTLLDQVVAKPLHSEACMVASCPAVRRGQWQCER